MSQSKKRKFKKSAKQQRRPLRKKAKTKHVVAKAKKNVAPPGLAPSVTPPPRPRGASPVLTDDELNALKNAKDVDDYNRIAREIKGRRDPSGNNSPVTGFYPSDWYPKVIAAGGVLEQLRARWDKPTFGTITVTEGNGNVIAKIPPPASALPDHPPPAAPPPADVPPPGDVAAQSPNQTAIEVRERAAAMGIDPPASGTAWPALPNPLPGDQPVDES